ncbi:unnamed protein product [Auanema sp. JU1783]|nr:unnamed protein product [Auanema sp. JU1783]
MNRQLLIPSQVKRILREILNKLYCLNDASEGSPEFFEYLSSLAALLGDEVVIDALAIAESCGVTYHFDEKMQLELPTKNEASEGNPKEMQDTVDPFALDDLLAENIVNEKEHSGVSDKDDPPNDGDVKVRNDSNDSFDIFSEHNSQENKIPCPEEKVKDIKPDLDDYDLLESSEPKEDGLAFYEVIFSLTAQKTCFIMPDINFCCCKRFQDDVIEKEKEYTCCHVIATWLAKALGTIQNIPEKPESLRLISQTFTEMVHEFH